MNLGFNIMHDHGKDLCFVGDTYHNEILCRYFGRVRSVVKMRLEQVLQQSPQWIDQHQFFCAVSNVSFSIKVADAIAGIGGDFFSVYSDSAMIGDNVQIGKNTLINHFNVIYNDNSIGSHCTLANYISVSHDVNIGDYGHVSSYTYLCFCDIEPGCYLGLRSSVFGYPDNRIRIPQFTNLLADSRLMQSLPESGTFQGRRKTDTRSSLELHL